MLPALQPSRPKHPQQSPHPGYAQQQKRAAHDKAHTAGPVNSKPSTRATYLPPQRPRSQIEAMPPLGPAQAAMLPPRSLYDSAVRHPVFFTEQLRKPPFPIPEMASRGFNPVASGYIVEMKRADGTGVPKTKL